MAAAVAMAMIDIKAPDLLVFNHIDRMGDGEGEAMARQHGGVAVALHRIGLRGLLARAERLLWADDEGRRDRPGGRGDLTGG